MRRYLTDEKRMLIQRTLSLRPHTYAEVAAITDLSPVVVARYLRRLRALDLVHVGAWDAARDGSHTVPKFKFGKSADATRPPPLTPAQRMARTRERRQHVHG